MNRNNRLKWALDRAGLNQRRFHTLMRERMRRGSSHGSIHNYLTGKSEPPMEFLVEAAKILKVSAHWLVYGGSDPPEPYPISVGPRSYTYSFVVWPDSTRDWPGEVFQVFEMWRGRIEMEFTEEKFREFRQKLEAHGFLLMEIERGPLWRPETVL